MKLLSVLVLSSALWAQQPQAPPAPAVPDLPESTVLAVFEDGSKFTMADFKAIFPLLSPQMQQGALRDRKTFLQQWALMRKLSQMAEKEKLDQESPTRETLDYDRMQIMSQAMLNRAIRTQSVDQNEILKAYSANKEKYRQVKVKAIYISFSTNPAANTAGKKSLSEAQAKAKAEKLLAEIRAGADFVKLVKENSDDEASRAKDGDFYTLRADDNVPEAIRKAVFALKAGEVSEPLRQPGGFYLLRAEEITYRPLSEVRDQIFQELKDQKSNRWIDDLNRNTKVQFTSPEFLGLQPLPQSK